MEMELIDTAALVHFISRDKHLSFILKNLLENNPGNTNPYHNNTHIMVFATFAYKGSLFSNDSKYSIGELIAAALMHDYGHAGDKDDSINISIACSEYRKLHKTDKNASSYDVEFVCKLIEATQYPYTYQVSDPFEELMRDCDMLQAIHSSIVSLNYGGLAKEFGSKLSDHANKQQEFFNGVKMLTSFGKYEWQNNFNTLSSISTNLRRAFIEP